MPTLTQYRQFAAKEAGRYYEGIFDSTGHTTTVFLDTQLITSLTVTDMFKDYWLYMPGAVAADNRLRVVTTGPATTGKITVDRAVSATTAPESQPYELHGMIAPEDSLGVDKLNWQYCINQALKRCLLVVEVTITPTASATRHSLASAASWVEDPRWVRRVGYLTSSETRANVDPYEGRAVRGYAYRHSNVMYLNHSPRTFATNETIYVEVLKSAYDHCRLNGDTYGNQSGLSLTNDEAVPSIEWVGFGALIEMARMQSRVLDPSARQLINANKEEWAAMFTKYTRQNFTLPPLTFKRITRGFGVPRAGGW